MKRLKTIYKRFRNLILYGMIGCLSSGLDFLIYSLLVQAAGIQYLLANCISVMVGITTSFTLNRNYNFKVKDNTPKRFVIFLAVGLSGMMLSNLILYLCIDIFGMNKITSKFLSVVLVVFFQFLLNKYVTFKHSTKNG